MPKQAFMQAFWEAWFVDKGLYFYKDFGSNYFPFLRMLLVPYHQLLGFNQWPTIVLSPINTIATLVILYWASRKWLMGKFQFIPIAFFSLWNYFLGQNHFVTTTFLGTTVLTTIILWLNFWEKPSKKSAFLTAFFASASLMSMQIVAPFSLLVLTSIYLRGYFIWGSFGFFLPISYVLFLVFKNNIFVDFYKWTFPYHLDQYPYKKLGKSPEALMVFFSIHLPLVFMGLNVLSSKKNRLKNIILLAIICTLPAMFWFAIFHPLRFQISLPTVSLIFALGLQNSIKVNKRLTSLLFLSFLSLNILSFTKYAVPKIKSNLKYNKKQPILSQLYEPDPMIETIEWIKRNTKEDDKLFALTDPILFIYSSRLPSNPRTVIPVPFTFLPLDTFEQELRFQKTDYWIIDDRLLEERFPDMGYTNVSEFFLSLLSQKHKVANIQYISIYK
jgi:hypothetical protein